jgi:hypothetical protein
MATPVAPSETVTDIQMDIQIPEEPAASSEVVSPVAQNSGPIAPTIEEINRATTIGGRISWTCMNCRQQSLCRDIGEDKWLCRGCESQKKMLEPPSSVPLLRHHITGPSAEARADFKRSSETAARQRQAAE